MDIQIDIENLVSVPDCENCGCRRRIEFQIMPQIYTLSIAAVMVRGTMLPPGMIRIDKRVIMKLWKKMIVLIGAYLMYGLAPTVVGAVMKRQHLPPR